MSFSITKAALPDANSIDDLVNSAYRGDSSKEGWTTEADLLDGTRTTPDLIAELLAKSDTTILKYNEDAKILACVELRKDGDKLYLGMLTVSPTLQGKGIGNVLLKAAEEEARRQDARKIYMTVISVRDSLIAWYKRHGYVETGERKPFSVPDSRWGVPKQPLEFIVLEKPVD